MRPEARQYRTVARRLKLLPYSKQPRIRTLWIKNLLAEICCLPQNARTCLVKQDQAGS